MKKVTITVLLALCCSVASIAQTIIYQENFETCTIPAIPAGWTEYHAGGGDGWETHEGVTRWPTYLVKKHTKYCIVDDHKKPWNTTAQLTTTSFSLAGTSAPMLSFERMHSGFWGYEIAWVQISTDGGMTYSSLDTMNSIVNWNTEYIDLSSYTWAANCKLRFCYQSTVGAGGYGGGLFGFAIDNIKVYDGSPAIDVGITYILPEAGEIASFVKTTSATTFIGGLTNSGTTGVSGFYVNWQAPGGPVMSQYIAASVPARSFGAFTAFSIPYTPATTGAQTIKIWLEVAGDTNPLNDTITTVITGVAEPNMPLKRMFIEEQTGTWCGWCPRGIVYMDSVWKDDSAYASIVCVHSKVNEDGMANDNINTRRYDTFTNRNNLMGYPAMMVDRRYRRDVQNVLTEMVNNKNTFGFAEIGLTHTITGGTIKARATIKPFIELTGDYRLQLIVTEDEVTGTTWQYQQANAYAASPLEMYGCGYNFDDSANIIAPGRIKFRFVARWTVPENIMENTNGQPGSLPSEMHIDSFYSYEFPAVTILPNWHAEKLRCVVALIDNNPLSPNYGVVLNSATTSHPPLTGGTTRVADYGQATDAGLVLYPNPAGEEVTVAFDLAAADVTDVCIYDMLGRRVSITPAQQLAGPQKININTTTMAPGTYTVMLRSGTTRISKRLQIVR